MEETVNTSPRQSPRLTQIAPFDKEQMNFGDALLSAADNNKIRRLEWEDKDVYLTFHEEQLMIFLTEDKKLHPLIVSTGDALGEDWVIVK